MPCSEKIRLYIGRGFHTASDDSGTLIRNVGFAHDVSEFEKRIELAQAITNAQRQFVSNVSHDLRTPLNAIIGCGHLLENEALGEAARDHLDTLNQASHHMLTLINDLLDLSKIEAGEFHLGSEPFALKDSVDSVINVMSSSARNKGINLVLDPLPEDLHGYYIGDPLRLRQVLFNLLGNAIKFTERGAVRLKVRKKETDHDGVERIRFDISDTGIGVSQENLEKLFKRFSQVDSADTRRFGGSGLGLSIVRELAERMGGKAEAHSEPGRGSTFSVEIELAITDPLAADAAHDEEHTTAVDLSNVRVLLVDDSSLNRKVATKTLTRVGAEVFTADDGQQALDWLNDNEDNVDIVLMDIQMPVMDGYTATVAIRKDARFERLPIVAMTAQAGASDHKQGLDVGMNDYITKPFDPERLYAVVREWVDGYRGKRQSTHSGSAKAIPAEMLSALPSVAGIDQKFVFAQFERSPELFNRYLQSFVRSFDAVSKSFLAGDDELMRRALSSALSSLQTSARPLGARDIERLSKRILSILETGSLDDAVIEIAELQRQMDAMRAVVRAPFFNTGEMAGDTTTAASRTDAIVDLGALRQLRFDLAGASDDAVTHFEALKTAMTDRIDRDELDVLTVLIDSLDFQGALFKLETLFPEIR